MYVLQRAVKIGANSSAVEPPSSDKILSTLLQYEVKGIFSYDCMISTKLVGLNTPIRKPR